MGPLALMAKAAGFTVFGSDSAEGLIHDELIRAGIEVSLGEQDGEFLKSKLEEGVDWFCHTTALKNDHPELVLAREA
jgi:UDP-N-acetylmuramate-alanine ligase